MILKYWKIVQILTKLFKLFETYNMLLFSKARTMRTILRILGDYAEL